MLNNVVTPGFTVGRVLRLTATAAIGGQAVGECYRNLKAHPGTGKSIIGNSIVGGVFGAFCGVGFGAWVGRGTLAFVLSHSMYGSMVTACYCNFHSTLKNKELKLFNDQPIQDVTLSTLTGAATGAAVGLLIPGPRLLNMVSAGSCVGFIGHYIYSGFRVMRLEFLIKQNYPELVSELKECSDWIDDQSRTNPYYAGPINAKPEILRKIESMWGDFGKNTDEKRMRFEQE